MDDGHAQQPSLLAGCATGPTADLRVKGRSMRNEYAIFGEICPAESGDTDRSAHLLSVHALHASGHRRSSRGAAPAVGPDRQPERPAADLGPRERGNPAHALVGPRYRAASPRCVVAP